MTADMTGCELLHEAFLLTWRIPDEDGAARRLHETFPEAAPEQVILAMHMAWTLRDVSTSVMVRMRSGLITEDEAMAELRRRCPGFADKTYLKAWAMGLCETSW